MLKVFQEISGKAVLVLYVCVVVLCLLAINYKFRTSLAYGCVVGSEGPTYKIAEEDLTEWIKRKAASIDAEKLKWQIQAKIKERLPKFRLPSAVSGLPAAKEEKVYKVDMTYTLPYDIKDLDGNIIYPKGYTFNPLQLMADKGIYYTQVLVIINAERKEEVEWFEKQFNDRLNVKLLITDGYAYELAMKLKRPVYYLTKILKDKFLIEETPSVVFQQKGDVYMTVITFAVQGD